MISATPSTNGPFLPCTDTYTGLPRRIRFAHRNVSVTEVIDSWLSPDHRYFKVRGDDGDTYILRHESHADCWELTLYERSGH